VPFYVTKSSFVMHITILCDSVSYCIDLRYAANSENGWFCDSDCISAGCLCPGNSSAAPV